MLTALGDRGQEVGELARVIEGTEITARHRILIEFDDGSLVKSVERSEQK